MLVRYSSVLLYLLYRINTIINCSKLNHLRVYFYYKTIIYDEIYAAVNQLIIPQKHGFVKKRSVESNLLLYTSNILECMDNLTQADAMYTDFCKAFDKANAY